MRSLPCELVAVLQIFSHDEELRAKALPHVDLEKQSINWASILNQDYSAGHSGAICWAYALWRDELPATNPFSAAFSMDAGLRRTVLRAIAIRWCIPMDGINTLRDIS